MILSVGMRTDIIGFYLEWFLNRVNDGYVLVRNPYNMHHISHYEITPEVIDLLMYCTKNPRPLVNHLKSNPNSKLWNFRSLYHVTITPYENDLEQSVPKITYVIQAVRELSEIVGKNKVVWRYDPICLTEKYTVEYHYEQFDRMASLLSGFVEVCIISFVDFYERTKRNAPFLNVISKGEQEKMVIQLNEIAKKYNMELRLCAEDLDFDKLGVSKLGCLELSDLERIYDIRLKDIKETFPREQCRCLPARDIGAYNSCPHGCLYCYANEDKEVVIRNGKLHNPNSPLLLGELEEEDVVYHSRQESYLDKELRLF